MKYIILASGKINSGKNFFSEMLGEEFKKRNLSVEYDLFAKDLKNGAKKDFHVLSTHLNSFVNRLKSELGILFDNKYNNPSQLSKVNQIIDTLQITNDNWYEDKTDITRLILQIYGTEIFRNRVNKNHWTDQVKGRAIESESNVYIVTDTRFPNEITCFNDIVDHDVKVIPIRINRTIHTQNNIAKHDSETSLDDWNEWCYVIDNNGSVDDLTKSASLVVDDILNESYETTNIFGETISGNLKKLETVS